MINKIFFIALIVFNIVSVTYLVLPTPTIPDLTQAVRSTEPGDTVQLKNVAGYYTNQSRTEVLNFYKANYPGQFRLIINHPPERAKEVIRDTTQSYYLYEFVLPFKESLFVNGFEWENDVFVKPEKRIANQLIYEGKVYKTKVTLKKFPTTVSARLINLLLSQTLILLIFQSYKYFFTRRV